MEYGVVLRKVQAYFDEMWRAGACMERHEPDEVDYWDILSGIKDRNFHIEKIATVIGKFKDAVAYAVQQPDFIGLGYPAGNNTLRDGLVKRCRVVHAPECHIPNSLLRELPKPDYQE